MRDLYWRCKCLPPLPPCSALWVVYRRTTPDPLLVKWKLIDFNTPMHIYEVAEENRFFTLSPSQTVCDPKMYFGLLSCHREPGLRQAPRWKTKVWVAFLVLCSGCLRYADKIEQQSKCGVTSNPILKMKSNCQPMIPLVKESVVFFLFLALCCTGSAETGGDGTWNEGGMCEVLYTHMMWMKVVCVKYCIHTWCEWRWYVWSIVYTHDVNDPSGVSSGYVL